MGHYRMKKQQQFDMSQQEIENEKKRLAAVAAQREVWERSLARAVEKATEQIEELGEQLDRDFEEDTTYPPLSHQPRGTSQQPTTASRTANLSLEDMMA
jgi:transketolase